MRYGREAAAALACALFLTGQAVAADLAQAPLEPVSIEALTTRNPWQIRVRALGVITRDSGSIDGVPGSDLSYSDTLIPELDISYFFTDNIAAELILGTTYANIHEDGAVGVPVGKAWLLPPTLTLQYHVTDFGAFKPYVGAGVNYTLFYNQTEKPGFSNLDVKNHLGAALQVGLDYMLDDNWGINVDVKKIFFKTGWSADHDTLGPLRGKAKIDPWLIGTGITYRF